MADILNVEQAAEFLGVSDTRVRRLARESLMNNVSDNATEPTFNSDELKRYKELAERIGGIN